MRILHALGWYFPDTVGGTEIYVQGLVKRLQHRGHAALVAAPRPGAPDVEEYDHDGVRVVRYPIPATLSRAEAQGAMPVRGVAEVLAELFARFNPDIFHVHSLVTGLGVHEMRAAKDRGISVVYTNHLPSMGFACPRGTLLKWGTTPCDGYQPVETCAACALEARGLSQPLAQAVGSIPARLTRPVRWVPGRWMTAAAMTALVADGRNRQQTLAELADRIVVLNDSARHIFVLHGARPERVLINRLGISGALHRKPGPDVAPTTLPVRVGFVGRFDPVKGVRQLAEAIERVPVALPLEFEFCGPSDDQLSRGVREELEERLGSDWRVTFAMPVAPAEVGSVLARMDVLICPSTWFENGPTVALEAHAVGTPVIASDFGAPREFVRDGINGRLIAPGRADAIVEALRSIAADPAATIDRWRRHLPPSRLMSDIVTDYEHVYRELVDAGSSAGQSRRP
jgi:glycosyltransferase involved in cell wall biosynthesis